MALPRPGAGELLMRGPRQILPSFTEIFGPREALPPPKPSEACSTLSHFTVPKEPQIKPEFTGAARRRGIPRTVSSPVRRPALGVGREHETPRKRKSDAVEEDVPRRPPVLPLERSGNALVPSLPAAAKPEAPSASLTGGWKTANKPKRIKVTADLTEPADDASNDEAPDAALPPANDASDHGDAAADRGRARKPRIDRGIDISGDLDVASIELPGETSDRVMVFDTCDMVRRKIRAFLVKPGMTQAAFLRALAATYSDGRRLQGAQLNRFLSMHGPTSGNTSGVFYAAYVFFEKLRIRDGKPKTPDRLEMERYHPEGFNVSEVRNYILAFKGERVGVDRFGRVTVQ